MKIYIATGFTLLNNPKAEEKNYKRTLSENKNYNRLISFYFIDPKKLPAIFKIIGTS